MAYYQPSLIRDAGEGLDGPRVEHQSANHNYVDDGAWLLELAKMVSLGLPKSNADRLKSLTS
jgi:hypothetical protein